LFACKITYLSVVQHARGRWRTSRLGAEVTGVDLSDKAIESAIQIAKETNSNANLICCDIYDWPQLLDKKMDIVLQAMQQLVGYEV